MNLPSEIETALRRSNPELLNRVQNALAESETLNPRVEKTLTSAEQTELASLNARMLDTNTSPTQRGKLAVAALKLRGLHDLFPRRTIAKA